MRNSPRMREARAFATVTLLIPLALTPAAARVVTPFAPAPAHATMAASHFSPARFYSLNRLGVGRSRSNRLGFDRFDNSHLDFGRIGPNRFRYNRFAADAGALDSGLLGFDGGGYWGYPPTYATAPSAPNVIGAGGPPVAINVYAGGGAGELGAADGPACPVVHLLEYDKAGHYTGERQIPGC